MVVQGTFHNGGAVPATGQTLPEGSLRELLLEFAGTIEGLPPDMAEQHDHYHHGRPKI
jgi:hypothetical protein